MQRENQAGQGACDPSLGWPKPHREETGPAGRRNRTREEVRMSEGPVKPQSHRIPLCYILSKCWLGEEVTKAGRISRFHAMGFQEEGRTVPGDVDYPRVS